MAGSEEKEAVLNVFAGLVRPLMRVAFEYGISASEIAGVVRRSYIQALEARLQEQRRPTTDARLAVVAGIPKSDVSAVREALRAGTPHSMKVAVSPEQIASLLTVWHTQSGFSGAYGLPMDLDLMPVPGSPQRSFQELIDIACPSADRDNLIDELVVSRSIEVIDGVTIRCLSRTYLARDADITRIERMGKFLSVVTANFVHNLLRPEGEPDYFERTVTSDEPLSEKGRDQFLRVSGEKGQELLEELDTLLTGLVNSDKDDRGKKYGMGIYFFEGDADAGIGKVENRPSIQPQAEKGKVEQEIDVLALMGQKK